MAKSILSPIVQLLSAIAVAIFVGQFVPCCARQVTGSARAEPPSHAFPDLAQFKDVDAQRFYTASRGGPLFQFSTTVGVQCQITIANIGCSGRISADPVGPTDKPCATIGPTGFDGSYPRGYSIERADGQCLNLPSRHPLLDAGQKVVVDQQPNFTAKSTCAVGPPERIACIDIRNHGFVIEPTGAWTF